MPLSEYYQKNEIVTSNLWEEVMAILFESPAEAELERDQFPNTGFEMLKDLVYDSSSHPGNYSLVMLAGTRLQFYLKDNVWYFNLIGEYRADWQSVNQDGKLEFLFSRSILHTQVFDVDLDIGGTPINILNQEVSELRTRNEDASKMAEDLMSRDPIISLRLRDHYGRGY